MFVCVNFDDHGFGDVAFGGQSGAVSIARVRLATGAAASRAAPAVAASGAAPGQCVGVIARRPRSERFEAGSGVAGRASDAATSAGWGDLSVSIGVAD